MQAITSPSRRGRAARAWRIASAVSTGPVTVSIGSVGSGTADIWAEWLQPQSPDTRVLLRYGKANGWLDGKPAAIERYVGKGSITYVGALIDKTLMQALIDKALGEAEVKRDFAVPADVELMTREGNGRRIVILINHSRAARRVALPHAMTNILDGGRVSVVDLPAEGVAVLQEGE